MNTAKLINTSGYEALVRLRVHSETDTPFGKTPLVTVTTVDGSTIPSDYYHLVETHGGVDSVQYVIALTFPNQPSLTVLQFVAEAVAIPAGCGA